MGGTGGLRTSSGGILGGRSSFLLVIPVVAPVELLLEVLRADPASVLSYLLLELLQDGCLRARRGKSFRFWHGCLPARGLSTAFLRCFNIVLIIRGNQFEWS